MTVWRVTPTRSASCACVISPWANRSPRIELVILVGLLMAGLQTPLVGDELHHGSDDRPQNEPEVDEHDQMSTTSNWGGLESHLGRRVQRNSDNRSPREAHRTRKNQLVPQIDQERTIDIGQDVHRTALLQHDLVDPGTVRSGGQIEHPPRGRPAQVQWQPDLRERLLHIQAWQMIGLPY